MAIEDYDLKAAFESNPQTTCTIDDVAAVEAVWTDGRDEPEFAWLLRLRDGRYAAATGGHDYTGWECQSSLSVTVHATRDDAVRFGFTLNDRCNLGLLLPGEAITSPR